MLLNFTTRYCDDEFIVFYINAYKNSKIKALYLFTINIFLSEKLRQATIPLLKKIFKLFCNNIVIFFCNFKLTHKTNRI